jgi:uncharacterized protein
MWNVLCDSAIPQTRLQIPAWRYRTGVLRWFWTYSAESFMPKILPVVRLLDAEQARVQAELALDCGADGVFLISHRGEDKQVLQLAGQLRHRWTGRSSSNGQPAWVGVNLLDTSPLAAHEFASQLHLDGLWLDAPGVNSHGPAKQALKLKDQMAIRPAMSVFGSVAFKYQPDESNRQAMALGMIPTTSGSGTGIPPSVEKIRTMSGATGGTLAVASGMTPENVHIYAPMVSHILVSTGVSKDEHTFDAAKLTRFVRTASGG